MVRVKCNPVFVLVIVFVLLQTPGRNHYFGLKIKQFGVLSAPRLVTRVT